MNKIIFPLFFIIFITSSVFSQSIYDSTDSEFKFSFRSFQIDASSIYASSKIGIAVDFDIFKEYRKRKPWSSIGFRFGADRIWKNRVVEPYYGSPFTHINGYLRFSVEEKNIRFDFYAGGAYQYKSDYYNTMLSDKLILKGGIDFKVKIIPYAGLLINGSLNTGESYFGLGIYFGSK